MGTTTTFEKGRGLIAVTGITQTIAVIVNNIASWTIIVVMYIIITLKNGALIVVGWAKLQWVVLESEELDKHKMVLPDRKSVV